MGFMCQSSLTTFVLVLGVLQGCYSLKNTTFTSANKLIPPTPVSAAVRGKDHTIYCSKNDTYNTSEAISWYDMSGFPIHLFDGDTKKTDDPDFDIDYDNQDGAYSNLLIKNMAVSKEGTYGCILEDEIHLATITMEVQASDFNIHTLDGKIPEIIEGVENSIIQLTCKSIAARPALELRWYQKKETDAPYTQITSGIQEMQSPNEQDSDTFDTTSDLRYSLHKSYHLGNLKCEAIGQTAATLPPPDVLTLVVQWLPIVYITYDREGTQIICNSDANPHVLPEDYALIVDGNRYNGRQTLEIEITKKTEVTCEASNFVGTGEAMIIVTAPRDDNEGLSKEAIIGFSVAAAFVVLCCVIATVRMLQKHRKRASRSDSKNSDSGM